MATPALEVSGLTAGYDAATVVRGVDLFLEPGELMLIAGPNGAGKSTLLRTIMGIHRASSGTVSLFGRRVERLPAHKRARLGMAWIPEGRGVISQLTVEENLDVARFSGSWEKAHRKRTFDMFPFLEERLSHPAALLSGGQQQMLALARALETGSHVLLVDEPSIGLAPIIVKDVIRVLTALRREGYSILLVEERAADVQDAADVVVTMLNGVVSERLTEVKRLSLSAYGGFDE